MIPFQIDLSTKNKPTSVDLPCLKLNNQILDYIRNFDYSSIPISDFQNTQCIPNSYPSVPLIDDLVSELFTVHQDIIQNRPFVTPQKCRFSETNTINMSNSRSKSKKQKTISYNESSVTDTPCGPITKWDDMDIDEINAYCKDMVQSHADTQLLLDGMLRLIGNVNLSWFYQSSKKLPLYVYEQLLPHDDKILSTLLLHYPLETENCVYYIIDQINDPARQFLLLNYCFLSQKDSCLYLIRYLLNDIVVKKSNITQLLIQSINHLYNPEFPMAHYFFKLLLNGLCIYANTIEITSIKSTWLDILSSILIHVKPSVGPTIISFSNLPSRLQSVWRSLLGNVDASSDLPSNSISNLSNLIYSIIQPCFKVVLQQSLFILNSNSPNNRANIKCKSIKLLHILYPLLPLIFNDKLQTLLVNKTRDPSALVRDTALDICTNYNLNHQCNLICIDRLNDSSIKVRKTAIRFITRLYTSTNTSGACSTSETISNSYLCALLLLNIMDTQLQPLVLKSLKAMILHLIPANKSFYQLNPSDKRLIKSKSVLLCQSLAYIYTVKNTDPTVYLNIFYDNCKSSQVDLFFQSTVDCCMLDNKTTADNLLYCHVFSCINYKWCVDYMPDFINILNNNNNTSAVLAIKCLISVISGEATATAVIENVAVLTILIDCVINNINNGSAIMLEYSMQLLQLLIGNLAPKCIDIDCVCSRIGQQNTDKLTQVFMETTNSILNFTASDDKKVSNRDALVCGLLCKYKMPFINIPADVMYEMFMELEALQFKCVSDMCIGYPEYILKVKELVLGNIDNVQHMEMFLRCLLQLIKVEDINKLEMIKQDEISSLVVDSLNMYLDVVLIVGNKYGDKIYIFQLLADMVYHITNESIIHPNLVGELFYCLLIKQHKLFIQHDGYITMINKYSNIMIAHVHHWRIEQGVINGVNMFNDLYSRITNKLKIMLMSILLNKIMKMNETEWIIMMATMKVDSNQYLEMVNKIQSRIMIEYEYKGDAMELVKQLYKKKISVQQVMDIVEEIEESKDKEELIKMKLLRGNKRKRPLELQ
eukprot:NODE_719_length_4821_cov_0.698009.p1 type:complete len:1048 gc:universal NODE_719_length_4821_cov_0.698009:3361-218(-)